MSTTITYKLYAWATATSTIAIIAVAAATNYLIDPAHIFDSESRYEHSIAKALLDGWNVSGLADYDERLTQRFYIDGLKLPPQIIILGSSRSMQIRASDFPTITFFNHAVSGASTEDYLGIYETYRLRGWRPDIVILGLDPWILNENNGQTRWRSLSKHVSSMVASLKLPPLESDSAIGGFMQNRYLQLVSYAYLESSLSNLWRTLNQGWSDIKLTKESNLQQNTKLADGSLVYAAEIRNRTASEVRIRASGNANRGAIYALNGFDKLDSWDMLAVDSFAKTARDSGTQVIFLLPPYHLDAYAVIRTKPEYQMVLHAEKYFRDLARTLDIKILGSYDPKVSGCSESEFTDEMHPTDTCMSRLIREATDSTKISNATMLQNRTVKLPAAASGESARGGPPSSDIRVMKDA